MKTIGIDVDSVIFPMNELVILPALERAGFPTRLEEITDFDYAVCLGREQRDVAFTAFKNPKLYDPYKLSPEVADGLAVLRSQYRVLAVTSPFAEHASSKWRYCLRAGFDHKDIVLAGDKTLLRLDVLVDDRGETCLAMGLTSAVVYDRPWNRQDTLNGFTRAYGWDDIPRKVARML